MATDYEVGVLVGLLVGEGHFGGDGKQPQVTLRMHVRHEALFRWIERTFPGGRLYGPYHHDGRHYYQWMARGVFLRDELLPMLQPRVTTELDGHSSDRFRAMCQRYARQLQLDVAADPAADPEPHPFDPTSNSSHVEGWTVTPSVQILPRDGSGPSA